MTTILSPVTPPAEQEEDFCDPSAAVANAVALLTSLGSAEEIAEFFTGLGIKGLQTEQLACPLSKYLSVRAGTGVFVTSRSMGFWTAEATVSLETTKPLYEFIKAFDNGHYPQLVERS